MAANPTFAAWSAPRRSAPARTLALSAAALVAAFLVARGLSGAFVDDVHPHEAVILAFIAAMIGAGLAYLGLFRAVPGLADDRRTLAAAFLVGLALRVAFFGSTPIYEDDWNRYLWDGAVVAAGIDPYAHAPADASPVDAFGARAPATDDPSLQTLRGLSEANSDLHARINYPFVSTIYPPLAQAAFAAAHKIGPFDLDAWRLILLTADLAALALLLSALKAEGRNRLWALLYWWNPLLILTAYNSGHMDLLLAPFLIAALLWVRGGRPGLAALALAGAAAIKLWPLILAPVLFRRWRARPVILVQIAALLVGTSALLLAPMAIAFDPDRSGLSAFAQTWRVNTFLFPLIAAAADGFALDGDLWARRIVALLVIAASLGLGLRGSTDHARTAGMALAVTACLFFLAPTGYPWYAVWLCVFLPFAPSLGVAALAATLPLYYARFYMSSYGADAVFDAVLTPIQFGVPLALVAWEMRRRHG